MEGEGVGGEVADTAGFEHLSASVNGYRALSRRGRRRSTGVRMASVWVHQETRARTTYLTPPREDVDYVKPPHIGVYWS